MKKSIYKREEKKACGLSGAAARTGKETGKAYKTI